MSRRPDDARTRFPLSQLVNERRRAGTQPNSISKPPRRTTLLWDTDSKPRNAAKPLRARIWPCLKRPPVPRRPPHVLLLACRAKKQTDGIRHFCGNWLARDTIKRGPQRSDSGWLMYGGGAEKAILLLRPWETIPTAFSRQKHETCQGVGDC